jgi:hypothetical protein
MTRYITRVIATTPYVKAYNFMKESNDLMRLKLRKKMSNVVSNLKSNSLKKVVNIDSLRFHANTSNTEYNKSESPKGKTQK